MPDDTLIRELLDRSRHYVTEQDILVILGHLNREGWLRTEAERTLKQAPPMPTETIEEHVRKLEEAGKMPSGAWEEPGTKKSGYAFVLANSEHPDRNPDDEKPREADAGQQTVLLPGRLMSTSLDYWPGLGILIDGVFIHHARLEVCGDRGYIGRGSYGDMGQGVHLEDFGNVLNVDSFRISLKMLKSVFSDSGRWYRFKRDDADGVVDKSNADVLDAGAVADAFRSIETLERIRTAWDKYHDAHHAGADEEKLDSDFYNALQTILSLEPNNTTQTS